MRKQTQVSQSVVEKGRLIRHQKLRLTWRCCLTSSSTCWLTQPKLSSPGGVPNICAVWITSRCGKNPLDGACSDGCGNNLRCGRLGAIAATELAAGGCSRVNFIALVSVFAEAKMLSCHSDYVVIGRLTILGLDGSFEIPDAMTMSIDIDCYTKADPGRIFDLIIDLGENSVYHHRSNLHLDAVSPELPSFTNGWQKRLIKVKRTGMRAWFLSPRCGAFQVCPWGAARSALDQRWHSCRRHLHAGHEIETWIDQLH